MIVSSDVELLGLCQLKTPEDRTRKIFGDHLSNAPACTVRNRVIIQDDTGTYVHIE